jgi:hypothetical protein
MKERKGDARDAIALAELIKPMLRGVEHGVQGVVLAQLLSSWIAHQHRLGPSAMEQILQHFMVSVTRLVGIEVAMIQAAKAKKGQH